MMNPIHREDVLRVMNQVSAPNGGVVDGAVTSTGSGGFKLDLDTIERVMGWLERAGPLFDKFSERFMQIKQFENGRGDIYDDGEALEMIDNIPPGPPPARRNNAVAPLPPPVVAPVGNSLALDPMALYQILLSTLAQLPPATTAAEALELATANKTIVVATIKQELDNMAKTN
jgi:hypothetical protein